MKQFIKSIIPALVIVAFGAIFSATPVMASPNASTVINGDITRGTGVVQNNGGSVNVTGLVTMALNYLMFAVATIAVVMIIMGGIRYATSGGNAEKVKGAKNTILYACIGLAVALLSMVIITFVSDKANEIGGNS